MELTHSFTIPAPIDEAWKVLQDIERIAPCMPGATLEGVEDDTFSGTVKVKVGPITVTYRGSATITERDEGGHRAVIEASGREARGSGTARATVTTTLLEEGDATQVAVVTDLSVTGKPAQFGRGVMADVAGKLLDRFADCLSQELSGPAVTGAPVTQAAGGPEPAGVPLGQPVGGSAPVTVPPSTAAGATPQQPQRAEAEAIDLFDLAGAPLVRRLGPAVAGAALLVLLVWLLRRRSSDG